MDGERTVGAAYVDLGIRRLGACQFHDDMEYCTLEALVVQLGARECAIPQVSLLWNMVFGGQLLIWRE